LTTTSLFCNHQKNTNESLSFFEQKLEQNISIWLVGLRGKQVYFFPGSKKGNKLSLKNSIVL
jgi:hypothetical protein